MPSWSTNTLGLKTTSGLAAILQVAMPTATPMDRSVAAAQTPFGMG